jgi:hypothetical protein
MKALRTKARKSDTGHNGTRHSSCTRSPLSHLAKTLSDAGNEDESALHAIERFIRQMVGV